MPHGLFADLILVYAVALGLIIVAGRVRIPPIIALIAAGVVSGPSGLAFIESAEEVDQLAEIGIVIGVTRERARQIQNAALHKLRSRALDAELDSFLEPLARLS